MSPETTLHDARVRSVHDVADGVRMLEIAPAERARPFALGSHLDIEVRVRDRLDTRSYSLIGERPHDGAYRIAVREVADSRGGSQFVRSLAPGTPIRVTRPRSHFELRHGCDEYLLVAGGIGITPLVGMSEALRRHGRPFRLLYAGRGRSEMAFAESLAERLGDRLELFVSGEGHRLDLRAEIDRLHPDGELYLCGPQSLREAAQAAWQAAGRPVTRLRFETFAAGGERANERFTVRVADHGDREIDVPGDRSMLDALADHDVVVMSDCRRGECGLCRVAVLDADCALDHRDVFLGDAERATGQELITCVSRARGGTIVIDTGFRSDAAAGAPAPG